MGDDDPDGAIWEFCGNFILGIAVAILIIVEILLPDIAQLEDPCLLYTSDAADD